MKLTKHHGLANDFLIAIEPPRPLTSVDAKGWCDRQRGIGADGLISAVADRSRWMMVLFNADGGEAEISGNGIRCLAQALADHLKHDRSSDLELQIESGGQVRTCTVLARPNNGDDFQDQVRVAMGKALSGPNLSSRWGELGVAITEQVGVDVGNPHLVAFVDEFPSPDDQDLSDIAQIGPVVEADYPKGCNVHLVRVQDRQRLVMKIWERGTGVTQACGSGASAATWAALGAGLIDRTTKTVVVDMPGGSVAVEVDGDEIVLTGPTVRIAGIEIR